MHGRIPLLDPSMVLLQTMIEGCVGLMVDDAAQSFSHRSWRGSMSVRCHLFCSRATHCESLFENLLGRLHIAFLAQAGINQVAIGITGTGEIPPLPFDPHRGFIHVPRPPSLSTPFGPQWLCNERGKPPFPLPNCLLRQHQTSLQKHFCQISQTQLVSEPPHNDQEDDIRRILQRIERRSSPFVERLLAG